MVPSCFLCGIFLLVGVGPAPLPLLLSVRPIGSGNAMVSRRPNKQPTGFRPADSALHRCILHLALENMLRRWRVLPYSARLDLYSLYLDRWQASSAFEIWFDIYPLLALADRYRFYRNSSLVFPDFANDMQATWYQCTLQGGLDELD